MTPDKNAAKPTAPSAAPPPKPKRGLKDFKLDSKNLRLLLMGGVVLSVVLFLAVALLGLSVLSSKSKELVDLKVQSQTTDKQLSSLEVSKKQVEKYSYFKGVAKTVIPSDKDQAAAVLEIFQTADAAGISIQSITFPASTLGLSTSTSATQDATSSSSAQNAITQAKPVSGIPGLYSLELTITPESGANVPASKQITYPKMLDFLKRIEQSRHTAQITQFNIQPGNGNQSLSFTLTINIFIKP
jgi:hypothetical protein